MQLIKKNGHVDIIHEGVELGGVYYRVRREKTTLEPNEILIDAGNVITVTFAGARLRDEFLADKDLITIKRRWTITEPGRWQLLFGYQPSADLDNWLVPSVMYDKNEMGEGRFPRGGIEKGWSFREDRIPIPSCSILHDGSRWQAVFTNPSSKENEISSVKTYAREGSPALEISVPYVEEPFTYTEKGILIGGLTAKTAAFFEIKKVVLLSIQGTFLLRSASALMSATYLLN